MRTRLVLLIVVALVATACDPGDIDFVLDEFPSADLSQSDDPGERTAGASAIEILTIREAEESFERGLDEFDLEAVQQAERLRPDDPKYDFYEAAILAGSDSNDAGVRADAQRALADAGDDYRAAHPDMSPVESHRAVMEAYINALRDVIRIAPAGEENDRRKFAYCLYINDWFPQVFTNQFPQETSFFLAVEADFSLCTNT